MTYSVAAINESVAGYALRRQIGKGGFGIVYEAIGEGGAVFALKLMRPTPFVSEGYLKKILQNTVEACSKCNGLNIVPLIAHGVYDSKYYIVSKYFRRGSLESLMSEKKISFSDKLNLLISMADTLSSIHSKGIVHGDIKPANFLISDEGIPFLSDFYFDLNKNSLSSGMPKGTIEYMSPEQAHGKLFSYQSDIYSLGVLAYHMFTEASPFKNASGIRELIVDKINGKTAPPRKTNGKIGEALNQIILRALKPELKDRYPTMKEFSGALKKL